MSHAHCIWHNVKTNEEQNKAEQNKATCANDHW